jgi:hypothetical protein
MVCATIPFLAQDLEIRNKEVLNGFYHPIQHYIAVAHSTIPACVILAFVISVIQTIMFGHSDGEHKHLVFGELVF